MEKITQQELKHLYHNRAGRNKTPIIDVRTLIEFIDFRIKKVPFIPLELLDHIQRPEARWNKSKPIYVISYTEARSKAFCHKLEALGYRTFYVEEGEVEAWCRKHLSVVNTLIGYQNTNKSALIATNSAGLGCFVFNFKISTIQPPGWVHFFHSIISQAWFFEKMNCNIKFVFAEGQDYFENSVLKVSQKSSLENCIALRFGWKEFPDHYLWISSEYAYSVMSRLMIKKDIQEEVDKWIGVNLKDNWIGVHYRGTDMPKAKSQRDYIGMNTYISYLKKVVDKHCSIFVCSDQAQFIAQMNDAFPGRVFYRDIQRSYDQQALHLSKPYKGFQQQKDALIDLLILSKADLIYKTGGKFSNLARFFNPTIKIIPLITSNNKWYKFFPENFVPPSKAHLLAK